MPYFSVNLIYKKQHASALILIVFITLIITIGIVEFSIAIIEQKKLINLEQQQANLNQVKYNALVNIKNIFSGYNNLSEIPSSFHIVKKKFNTHVSLINQRNQDVLTLDDQSYIYKIYRIDLLVDDQYASKLHIYLAVCEDISTELRVKSKLKIIPISKLLE